jgi:hypothetical protein
MKFEPKAKHAVCTICGVAMVGAVCIHTKQLATDPLKASDIEITKVPGLAALSTHTAITYDITTAYDPTSEQHHRTDMPWRKGFMTTKRST